MDEKQALVIRYKAKLTEWVCSVSPDADADYYPDDILCHLLEVLGYGEVVETYCKLRDEYNE